MPETSLEVDYLIVGAGAVGMAFADSLLTETDATIALVDRRDRPGGHWNDAYPFVRLHQPSLTYGLNSRPLGSGTKDEVGLNKGLFELASGHEVVSHFDLAMQQTFLPSGRVRWFPMSEFGEGEITSLVSGARTEVTAAKTVDAAHSTMAVPSTHPPEFGVARDTVCVPVNELARRAGSYPRYTVVGAGKTGMDACIWLLQNGADPDHIRWIMPRDYWLLSRRNVQLGEEFFARVAQSLADQVQALAEADSIDDLFARLEVCDEVRRIDASVHPRGYHCAIVSDGELAALRSIRDVVRLGRVERIEPDEIVLEQGTIATAPDTLYIDCSATGIPARPSKPVFDGDRITPQWVRVCQPTFSAALIGHVEAAYRDEDRKNEICTPIAPPSVPADWVRMMEIELANRACWGGDAELSDWLAACRLDQFTRLIRERSGVDPEAAAHLGRYLQHVAGAAENAPTLSVEE